MADAPSTELIQWHEEELQAQRTELRLVLITQPDSCPTQLEDGRPAWIVPTDSIGTLTMSLRVPEIELRAAALAGRDTMRALWIQHKQRIAAELAKALVDQYMEHL